MTLAVPAAAEVQLRPYQLDAVDAVESAWARGMHRPAVVLATGLGKTVVIADLATRARREGRRVILLAHQDKLLHQMAGAVQKADPCGEHVGIVAADLDDPGTDIVAATFQTIKNPKRFDSVGHRDLVISDECFPAGTLIAGRPIESILPGHRVPAFDETTGTVTHGQVVRVFKSRPTALVRVVLASGRDLVCTPGHPLWSREGWIPAIDSEGRDVGVTDGRNTNPLHSVHQAPPSANEVAEGAVQEDRKSVLLGRMSGCLRSGELVFDDGSNKSEVCARAYEISKSNVGTSFSTENGGLTQGDKSPTEGAGRQWYRRDSSPGASSPGIGRIAYGGHSASTGRGASSLVQPGHSSGVQEDGYRGGRWESRFSQPEEDGRQEGTTTSWDRVVGLEVHQRGSSDEFERLCPDGFVYNLEVEDYHTYVVDDYVIVHNCHHSPAPSFLKVLETFGATKTGTTLAAGFTATMSRADSKALGHIWDEVVYERDLAWAVQNGYLVSPRGKTVHIAGLSKLADISQVAGDYKKSDLAELMGRTAEATVGAIVTHAADRPMIVFAVDVAHAHSISDLLNTCGIVSAVMSGKTPRKERARLYEAYAKGHIQALVNVQVLTEGVDLPRCDTVVMARPTRSQTLYSQAVGRALRLWTDPDTGTQKTDALVLDLVGVVRDLRLVTVTDLMPTAKNTNYDEQGREILPKLNEPGPGREQSLAADIPDLVDIDLFNQKSSVVWLKTEGGVYFTPLRDVRDGYVFLWPPNPVEATEVALGRLMGRTVEFLQDHQGTVLTGSMAEARDRASQHDILPPNKALSPREPWRKRRNPPSQEQIKLARKLRIDPSQFSSRAELSDALTRFWANKTFQRMSPIINAEAGLTAPMWDSGFTFRNTPEYGNTATPTQQPATDKPFAEYRKDRP